MSAEWLGFTAAYGVAFLIAAALLLRRSPRRAPEHDHRGFSRWLYLPMFVLIASEVAVRWAEGHAGLAGWLAGREVYRRAWFVFWTVALFLGVAEGALRLAFAARRRPFPVPALIMSLARGVTVLAVAFWLLRSELGMDISLLLGSTALVTAVVGFALQGVLGNLLGGMSLHVVRSFREGDWVNIAGYEGCVTQINWRETRLRTTDGQTVILPNSLVSASTIQNLTQPDSLRRHEVFAHAAPEHPAGLVIEALRAAAANDGRVLADPPPAAMIAEVKEWGIRYRLFFWSRELYERRTIEGSVLSNAWYQFQRRGIRIPFAAGQDALAAAGGRTLSAGGEEMSATRLKARKEALCSGEFGAKVLGEELRREPGLEEGLVEMARHMRRLMYEKGETVFRQGEPGDTCYVVARGRLLGAVRHPDKPEPVTFDLSEGALFGEMSLMTGLPRAATITASGHVELFEISGQVFGAFLARDAQLAERLATLIAEREAGNAEAHARLSSMEADGVRQCLQKESILARLMRLIALP